MRRIAYKHVSLGIRPEQYTIVGQLPAGGGRRGARRRRHPRGRRGLGRGVLAVRDPADRRGGPALPAGAASTRRTRCGRTGWSAGSRRPRRRVLGAGAGRRRRRCRRSRPASTSRCSSTCPTGGASRASTRSPPRVRTRLQITVRRVRGVNGAPDGMVSSLPARPRPGRRHARASAPRPATSSSSRRTAPLLLASAGAGHHHRAADRRAHRPHPAAAQGHRRARRPDRARTTRCARPCCTSAGRSTTSPPTPGTRASTPATRALAQGYMDLTEVPLPDDVQVFTCGPLPFMRHVRSTPARRAGCRRPASGTRCSARICGPRGSRREVHPPPQCRTPPSFPGASARTIARRPRRWPNPRR